jgi:hypothetical protein
VRARKPLCRAKSFQLEYAAKCVSWKYAAKCVSWKYAAKCVSWKYVTKFFVKENTASVQSCNKTLHRIVKTFLSSSVLVKGKVHPRTSHEGPEGK